MGNMLEQPTHWCWRPKNGAPLHVEYAFNAGVSLREKLLELRRTSGKDSLPDAFHHSNNHSHARYLALDLDEDGLIDCLMLHVRSGLPAELIPTLAEIDEVHIAGGGHVLEPMAMGPDGVGGPFGPARVWKNATPWVTPWSRLSKTGKERPDHSPELQFRRELEALNLEPVEIHWEETIWLGDRLTPASQFAVGGAKRGIRKPPPGASSAFATLVFEEPMTGPLAMGYGSHFGLGLFMPIG